MNSGEKLQCVHRCKQIQSLGCSLRSLGSPLPVSHTLLFSTFIEMHIVPPLRCLRANNSEEKRSETLWLVL